MPDFLRNCADVLEPMPLSGWMATEAGNHLQLLRVNQVLAKTHWVRVPTKRQIADFVLGTGVLRDAAHASSTGPKIA